MHVVTMIKAMLVYKCLMKCVNSFGCQITHKYFGEKYSFVCLVRYMQIYDDIYGVLFSVHYSYVLNSIY